MRKAVLQKEKKKVKKITVIGITNLLGEPICCIVIVEGKEELFGIRDDIDILRRKLEMKLIEKNTFA